jgi:SSS family solute:Na+ symporter
VRALDALVVLAYVAGMCVIGVRMGRREQSREEYFLAGRRMPWFFVGVSILATMLSTISYLSLPGEIVKNGIAFLAVLLAYPVVYPVFAYGCIPRLFRLPATSVYEYLDQRYGGSVRTSVAVLFLATRLTWLSGIVFTSAYALAEITGVSIYLYLFVIGLPTTYYTTHGGVRAVIWTDVAQFFLLFGGAMLVPLWVLFRTGTGPADWWRMMSEAGQARVQVFSWDPTVRVTVVAAVFQRFFFTLCTHTSDQVAAQRYFTTPSVEKARLSFLTYLVSSLAVTVLLAVCGLALFGFYRHGSPLPLDQFRLEMAQQADRLLPRFIAHELPPGLAGLMIAAVLAAGMSSLSSGINSITAVLTVDFIQRGKLRLGKAGENAKALSAWIGAGITVAAIAYTALVQLRSWNLLEANLRLGTMLTGPMAVPFLAGLLFRRPGPKAAMLGLAGSTIAGIVLAAGSVSFLWIIPATTIFGIILTVGASPLEPGKAPTYVAQNGREA